MKIEIPSFEEKKDLIDWLISNKSIIIAEKKSATKYADAIGYSVPIIDERGEVVKSETIKPDATKIKVRSVINTTKLYDSHGDVHIDQLWNKSLKENKENYLVQEHNLSFAGIITDNVKAFAKQMTWQELGFNFSGGTQALVFDSVVDKERNPFMFEQYKAGRVRNHSIGMRYMKMEFAVNDERYEKEKAVWDKYYPEIANKNDVDEAGYFFAVLEAKIIEGSAVVRGSNNVTPTISVTDKHIEAGASTSTIEPPLALKPVSQFINPNFY